MKHEIEPALRGPSRIRYLAIALPLFSLASAVHAGCSGGGGESGPAGAYSADAGTVTSGKNTGKTCTNIGSCGPLSNNCNCGLSCVHIGEGSYKCGFSCTTAQDCASKANPSTGSPWHSCEPPHTGALDISYEGYCD